MHVGFVVSALPRPSATFISREFMALRGEGLRLSAAACGPPSAEEYARFSAEQKAIADETYYMPANPLRLAAAGLQGGAPALLNPRRFPAAFRSHCRPVVLALRAGALAAWIRREGVTQLHVHWPYATMLAYLVNQMTGIPYTVSAHVQEIGHENYHFPAAFQTLRLATFCNRAAMDLLLGRLPPESRKKCHLVYHGVDLARFAPAPFPETDRELRIYSAGRLTPTKGFVRLVEACARARRDGVPVKLTIIGEGPMRADIEAAARELAFTDGLSLPGWVPHDEIVQQVRSCHVVALLGDATFHDGLSNAVLEGMAIGRPVLLTPMPAAAEVVDHGVEGLILPAVDDAAAAAAAVRQLWEQRARLPQMGQAAAARIRREHDAQAHVRHLAALLKEAGA